MNARTTTFDADEPAPAESLGFRSFAQRHVLARIQERTGANLLALLRFVDEKRKHPELVSLQPRIATGTLPGYRFVGRAEQFSPFMPGKGSWAVEIFLDGHGIRPEGDYDGELRELVRTFDALLVSQAAADAECLLGFCQWARADRPRIERALAAEYRRRFIGSRSTRDARWIP